MLIICVSDELIMYRQKHILQILVLLWHIETSEIRRYLYACDIFPSDWTGDQPLSRAVMIHLTDTQYIP